MAARRRSALKKRAASPATAVREPLVYTAQDVARFCEVDLKTIHHWAEAGKIAHHRTTGRHLRFRRNHVLAFLRRHGYPLPPELVHVRPTVLVGGDGALDDAARKLASRFFVHRSSSALGAIAHLIAEEPDAIVVAASDTSWNGPSAIAALKSSAETAWPMIVVIAADESDAATLREAGADMVLAIADLARLTAELGRALAAD